jgi:hypothetical protein
MLWLNEGILKQKSPNLSKIEIIRIFILTFDAQKVQIWLHPFWNTQEKLDTLLCNVKIPTIK